MFTGIIETVGTIADTNDLPGLRRMVVAVEPSFLEGVTPGASIAVDGACLTPVEVGDGRFTVEVVVSTLERTVAGRYEVGSRVNLERAMLAHGRLDGHVVQGHVDGVGEFLGLREEGDTRFLDFRIPEEVWALTILHGSIALNGISLTVNGLDSPDRCQVAIIPHTWTHTNFSFLVPGDGVNVEGDLMGKYVRKILGPRAAARASGGS